ncbi:hypothetical protein L1987_13190 [Smallanthus sonchifolius]|uniref:Uncharacterized protein n=1 Tax=Smallanthus sonchifolius TaxID=185202 RepID=A0ACB9JI46_9ASTR|nr:hypothetical protein L1987_13190 [Smallanthus sonchifolius]
MCFGTLWSKRNLWRLFESNYKSESLHNIVEWWKEIGAIWFSSFLQSSMYFTIFIFYFIVLSIVNLVI